MSSIKIPPDLDKIFEKFGRHWTQEERDRVCEWFWKNPQFRYLVLFAFRQLCKWVKAPTPEDAEDTWGEFFAKRIHSVINTYDPAKGRRFWEFLLLCFERFCQDEGEKIRRQAHQKEPLEKKIAVKEGEYIELEIPDPAHVPLEALVDKERYHAVQECLDKLPPNFREVIIMLYFEEKSVKKIKTELGISSEANVKIQLFRARQQLAECLQKEGWTS